MSETCPQIPELEIPERLVYLIQYCEKPCVAQCCGVDAFDFSPLHVASFVSGTMGSINNTTLAEWTALIDQFERSYRALQPPQEGRLVCVITPMNQFFTKEAFETLIVELRTSLATAPEILKLSNQLRTPITASRIMKNFADQERTKIP